MSLTAFIYLDIFIDTEKEVLAMRATAKQLFAEGKTTMTWTGEGVSASKQFVAPVLDILAETRQFLKLKNSSKYGRISTSASQLRY
jgi:hypothetical protein